MYELGGDTAFTLAEYAAAMSAESGTEVDYRDLSALELSAALAGAGVPEPFAAIPADSDAGIARGEQLTDTGDLSNLIGRPTSTPTQAVRAALA